VSGNTPKGFAMPPTNLLLTTCTAYRSTKDLRFTTACRTIEAAVRAGYPILVIDDSSYPSIRENFRARGAHIYRNHGKSYGASKRQSLYHAMESARLYGTDLIVAIEPEKTDLIHHMETLVQPFDAKADVVVMTRSEKSFATYPDFQIASEQEANRAFESVVGLPLDIMVGPVGIRVSTALPHFLNPSSYLVSPHIEDTYIQHYGAIVAHAYGLRVVPSPPIDFIYPENQRREEEAPENDAIRMKRQWQCASLIRAYAKLAHFYKIGESCQQQFLSL